MTAPSVDHYATERDGAAISHGEGGAADVLILFAVAELTVLAGVTLGAGFVPGRDGARDERPQSVRMASVDGAWFARIARHGYDSSRTSEHGLAFFPLYPATAAGVAQLFGAEAEMALVLVANTALLASAVLFGTYLKCRSIPEPTAAREASLALLLLFPTTFYFRMAYAESLFLLLLLMPLYAMERRWRIGWVALIAGAASATRTAGVALLLPLCAYSWSTSGRRIGPWLCRAPWFLVACWGLVGFMVYQHFVFGDALAFNTAQEWFTRKLDIPLKERVLSLATLEPIWSVYVPGTDAYWTHDEVRPNALFSLQFWNPIYFVGAALLVALGAWKRWLTPNETLLSAALLVIPYLTHSQRGLMMGHARYASVVFPAYIVLGRLLARMPRSVVAALFALSGFFLGAYSALFSSGYRFI
jgi:hypothetical protein